MNNVETNSDQEKAITPTRSPFHFGSIRARLLIIFILLVLLPAVAIGAASAVGSLQSGKRQVFDKLESVATLKESEIDSWLQGLATDLNVELARESSRERMSLLLQAAPGTPDFQTAHDAQVARFRQSIELRKDFEELFLMDLEGQVVLSTDPAQQGKLHSTQAFFKRGLKDIYMQPPLYSVSHGRVLVVLAHPVTDDQGQVLGVLAGRANMARLSEIMRERTGMGETGETYLVGGNKALLTESRFAEDVSYVRTRGTANAIESQANASGVYEGYRGALVVGVYHWLPELQIALMAEQDRSEAFGATYATLGIITGIALAAVLSAVVLGLFVTQSIANPLADLAETSRQIAAGDLTARAEQLTSGDEIGVLATSFNAMADRVSSLLTGLQERSQELAERTRELEASQRVTFAASERVSPAELLGIVVNLIRDQFDLYHVQVYVVDEGAEAAVLRESTGYAGRQLLQRQHQIPLEREQSLVIQAISQGQPVLVDDVSQDPNFMPNPLLPDTQSELVVPLKVGERVLGALDAQDRAAGRFSESTVALFQTMADQISFLFENSELLERVTQQTETLTIFTNQLRTAADIARRLGAVLDPERLLEQLVEMMQSRFGLYHAHIYVLDEAQENLIIRAGSGEVGRVLQERGHRISLDAQRSLVARAVRTKQVVLVEDTSLESDFMPNPLLPQTRSEMAVPLVFGDEIIGVLDVQDDQPGRFRQTDQDTFTTLAGQVATALQNASLFEQVESNAQEAQMRFEVSQALVGAQTEEEALDALLEASSVYPECLVGINLFAPEEEELTAVIVRTSAFESGLNPPPVGQRFKASEFPMLDYLNPGEVFVINDTTTDERVDPVGREFFKAMGMISSMIVPIAAGGEWLGYIAVGTRQENYFDDPKIRVFQSVAEQGAVALHTARLRDEIARTAERLREMDRLKSEFLANMSHELRTPLNSILGYTEVMLMGISGELDPEMMEDAQAIYDNGQHLLRLINDILDLAKIEAGRMTLNVEEVDIEPLFEDVKTSNAGLLVNKPVEMILEVEEGLPAIHADRTRVSQILNNLVSNAVKFTKEGHITMRAFREDEERICLEVEDTGIGIKEEDLATIFEQFRQGDGSFKKRAEGTGLGLAITRHLVHMHGGSIQARSQVDEGSTFTVRLPIESRVVEAAIAVEGDGQEVRVEG